MWSSALYRTVLIVATSTVANTKELEIPTNDPDALSLAVKQVSNGVFTFYNNDNTGIGLFPEPYDWSQSGAAWDSLVNYWYLTGDTSHNSATQAALSAQIGPDDNYLVPNQTISEGNENQTVWGLAALTAAERNFPQADGQGSSWEDLARNVFDGLAPRWDTQSCGGGLRSQIFTFNSGYNWKNSASQALFFQLAARLAHFTGNQTYVYWASRTYNWTRDAGLIGDDFAVYDGASANDNCSNVSGEQWSYTAASFAYGSAVLANFTSDSQWTDRTTSHLSNLLGTFFPSNILTEPLCDPYNNCTTHQLTTRALTLRYLSLLPFYVPSTHDQVWPALNTSAAAAATRCTVADGTGDSARAGCRGRWNASTTSSPSSSPSRSSTSTFSAATATATSDHSVSDGDFDSDNDGRPDDWDTIDDNPYDVGNNNHTSPPSSSNNSNDHDDNNNDDNDDDNPPGTGDDTWGLGQQLAALEVLQRAEVESIQFEDVALNVT
ncbi:glycosyl hydrolase family 76-domain-containing protein [Macrophomina phaseolina]|uniref:Mannan endo-1,6-alpha-mannosidase n=1 Tax=Macrophomina phaseolina TaxID=35725 RepID=A0ABQ8GER0_9PEZI|nr:glycosyl hydrolase family 76-domain-containing protein [Macrophomina phaseolina]